MANPKRGEIEIELGGVVRTLRFDYNALARLEDLLQMPVTKVPENLGVKAVVNALYVGLSRDDPKLTPRKVGEMMDREPDKFDYFANMVVKGIMAAMGYGDEGDGSGEEASPKREMQG